MKAHYKLFSLIALVAVTSSYADIKPPSVLNCTATKITPEGARFFGHGIAPVVGDRTQLDLGAAEILGIKFESGAHIGATVHKHALVKTPETWEGFSHYAVSFKSKSNGNHYEARLTAHDDQKKIVASVDVVELATLGRLTLNSIELDCNRN